MEQKNDHQVSEHDETSELILELPKVQGWIGKDIYNYQGYWFYGYILSGVLNPHNTFKAPPTNQVLLASYPKSGTTWLKALTFSILNRNILNDFSKDHPLLIKNPHECVSILEAYDPPNYDAPLLQTHIPFTLLPQSIRDSSNRIIYVVRNPKDVFISLWHHELRIRLKELPPLSMEEAFEMFCEGTSLFGPYWDQVSSYMKASLEFPERIKIIKYEEMKTNPVENVKKLAEFIGEAFSAEEEKQGMVEKIVSFCSFENLSNLEVNKTGSSEVVSVHIVIPNDIFFRKGEVGDSKNYLTKEMIDRIDGITSMKLKEFDLFSPNA